MGFWPWQGRVEKAPARRVFSEGPRLLTEAFRGPKALEDRRRKPIIYPTLTKNRRGAQRNEDLVVQASARLAIRGPSPLRFIGSDGAPTLLHAVCPASSSSRISAAHPPDPQTHNPSHYRGSPFLIRWNPLCPHQNSSSIRFEDDRIQVTASEASGLIRNGKITGTRKRQ